MSAIAAFNASFAQIVQAQAKGIKSAKNFPAKQGYGRGVDSSQFKPQNVKSKTQYVDASTQAWPPTSGPYVNNIAANKYIRSSSVNQLGVEANNKTTFRVNVPVGIEGIGTKELSSAVSSFIPRILSV